MTGARQSGGIRQKLLSSLLAASIGAALGYGYAQVDLPEHLREGRFPGMYATAGAAIAVLALRLFSLGRTIMQDYLQKNR